MADNILRTKGRPQSYKFDRGGQPAEFGPFIGVVKNNIDPTRSGRLQVYIEQFAGDDPDDASLWRTVSYIPPFYGVTPKNNATGSAGTGSYEGNQNAYGMWFTPPDLGVKVICFFVAGDPNQGYYIGCVPDPGVTHMIPAIGSSLKFETQNDEQKTQADFAKAKQLPVVEINQYNEALYENPRFFAQPKPVHSYVFTILMNQGLLGDYIRGPISSSAQRESPSSVFGISTPGRAIYQGGLSEKDVKAKLDAGTVKIEDIKIEGRRGGHSIVMDDGDLRGRDNLIRIRTAKGHQITMSDEADCFYFIHANGQTWLEFGTEGTVDVYTTNSVNFRSQGVINLHADADININAKQNLNIRAGNINIESQNLANISAENNLTIYSKTTVGVLSDGSIALNSQRGSWNAGSKLVLKAGRIDLNGGPAPEKVEPPKKLIENKLDDTKFVTGKGWTTEGAEKIETIVTRAPTHEPWPYHNKGVPVVVELSSSSTAAPTNPPASTNTALESTKDAQPKGTVTTSSVLTTPAATSKVGTLSKQQVTGLTAQAKSATNQPATAVSVDKGIGEYGFKPAALETSGYLKPGTVSSLAGRVPPTPTAADRAESQRIISQGGSMTPEQVAASRQINDVLRSPTVWSGKSGVTDLNALLGDPKLQASTQQNLLSTTLRGLQTAGLATGREAPAQLGALVQTASTFGVGSVDQWVKGTAPANLVTSIGGIVKGAEYATKFVTDKLGSITGALNRAAPVSDTVDRTLLDSSLVTALDNAKIPPPEFKPAEREEDQPSQFEAPREDFQTKVDDYFDLANDTRDQLNTVLDELNALSAQDAITASEIDAIDSTFQSVRQNYNSKYKALVDALKSAADSAPQDLRDEFAAAYASANRLATLLINLSAGIRELIAELRDSIA